jgi:hypothetical protein
MWLRFAMLSNLGVGAGAILYAWLLFRRHDGQRLHGRLGFFLICLGGGLVTRGLYSISGSSIALDVMWLTFSVSPLALALFFEALLHRPLPLVLKLLLLLGTAGIGVGGLIGPRPSFSSALMGFNVLVMNWLGLLSFLRMKSVTAPPVRRFYGTAAVLCAVSAVLVVLDWVQGYGLEVPRLGGLAAALAMYFAASHLHGGADVRLSSTVGRLLLASVLSLIAAAIITALHPEAANGLFASVVASLLALELVVEPLRMSVARSDAQSYELALERLSRVPLKSLDALTATLRGWPELRRLEYLDPEKLKGGGYDRLAEYFAANGNVVSAAQLRLQGLLEGTAGAERSLEQLLHLMQAWDLGHVAWLGPGRGVLGVSFNVGLEERIYARFFSVVALLYQVVPATERP